MKTLKIFFWGFVLVIAFAAGLYANRFTVSEFIAQLQAPELPEAVSYEDVQEGVLTEPVDEVLEDEIEDSESIIDEEAPVEEEEEEEVLEDLEGEITEDPIEEETPTVEEEVADEVFEKEVVLPASVNLAVPFTSQAPHGVWEMPYKEACEEASLYMAHAFFDGVLTSSIDSDTADQDLVKMVAFENDLFGYFEDTTAEQTALIAEMYYGYQTLLIEDPTVEQIKEQLALGRPVIVPAAGQLLGNPYFTAPGPLYHMLILRGYTASNQFIANDPGTKRGEAYVYDIDTIMNAMHDWNNGGEITEGRKVVLVVYP